MTGGALKYYRGGFGGPTKRDYGGGNVVWGAGASHMLWTYFGDAVGDDPSPQVRTGIHPILSSYRPPQAVIGLATKNWGSGHAGRVEMINTKPSYAHWADPGPGEIDAPETWETLFYGQRYYLGSCVSRGGIGDVGPFKLLANNDTRGVDFFVANSGTSYNTKRSKDQISQHRSKLIWLRPDGAGGISNFRFQAPASATVDTSDPNVWFFRLEDDETWVALRPINMTYGGASAGSDGYVNEMNHTANQVGGSDYFGFAMEVGEKGSGGDQFAGFNDFKTAILGASLDLSNLAGGEATLHGTDGSYLKTAYNPSNDLPAVYRNSSDAYDWEDPDNYAVHRSINEKPTASLTDISEGQRFRAGADIGLSASASDTGQRGPVSLDWKRGVLTVLANDYLFEETVDEDGNVTWSERAAVGDDYLGKVIRVEFYAEGELLGEDDDGSDGWGLDWLSVGEGDYTLLARAIDNDTEVGWSEAINISVIVPIAGDINLDDAVDQLDFDLIAANWDPFGIGHVWEEGDLDGDGAVGNSDFAIVLGSWTGAAAPLGQTVPEPATLLLLTAGAGAVLARRRK
jgi:hypothetical protein